MAKSKTATTKKPTGRPSKRPGVDFSVVKRLALAGCTMEQIAAGAGVSKDSLERWAKADPALAELMADWKAEADDRVERALYSRACGFVAPDKVHPPDSVACIFWLKNRRPKEWRDKQDVEHSGTVRTVADMIAAIREPSAQPEGDNG